MSFWVEGFYSDKQTHLSCGHCSEYYENYLSIVSCHNDEWMETKVSRIQMRHV